MDRKDSKIMTVSQLFSPRFSLKSNGPRPYSPSVMQEYPLVQLQGNHRIVLEHYPKKVSNSGRYE